MKTLTAKEAKNRFGWLVNLARTEPVTVTKHGLPVVVVMPIDEFDRLNALEHSYFAEANHKGESGGDF